MNRACVPLFVVNTEHLELSDGTIPILGLPTWPG